MKILITSVTKIVDANIHSLKMNQHYDKIIFCHGGEEKYKEIADNLKRFDEQKIIIETINYDNIEELFKQYLDQELRVQLNGYSSIEMYIQPIAYKYKVPMVYFDIRRNEIVDISTNQKFPAKEYLVTLEESLALLGASVRNGNFSHVNIDTDECKLLCDIAMDRIEDWKEMVKTLTFNQSIKGLEARVNVHNLPKKLVRNLEKLGFITLGDKTMYFKNHTVAYVMTHEGAFLELFVYHNLKASNRFDEVYSSVVIEWSKEKAVFNEIDLIARAKENYYFISCKSRNIITKDFVYEIVLMSKNFMVENCVPVLVSGASQASSERLEYYDGILILLNDLKNRTFVEKIIST